MSFVAARKKKEKKLTYTPKGNSIEKINCSGDIGVDVLQYLFCEQHISHILAKQTECSGFYKGISKLPTMLERPMPIRTIVRPQLVNWRTAWSLYYQDQINRAKTVQCKKTYISNNYHNTSSETPMLYHLEFEKLSSRHTKSQLTVLYKIKISTSTLSCSCTNQYDLT